MYLGIDLGTSAVKAVLISEQGALLSVRSAPLTLSTPQPLWSEQDPQQWWQATLAAVKAVVQDVGERIGQLRAIGLSGQMHGATFVDTDGQVLRPCILWNDGRSARQCRELERQLPDFHERCGNLAMPGFTAPKVLWVAAHEPQVFERTAKVLLPKDYLAWRLTGRYCSDMSDAAGTLWLNPQTRDWDDELLRISGLSRTQMPELLEGCDQVGPLLPELAAELGLPTVPVVIGGGDNACGAVGVGVTEPGQAFLSLGTSGVLFVVSEGHCASPEHTVHAFCHALPHRWHQMSVCLTAASALAWFARTLQSEVADVLQALEDSDCRTTPVVFVPYLSGERTPHNDPQACGQFFGLRQDTTREEMTLAVLEGVAFAFADGYAALQAAGSPMDEITCIGGGARSARWRQLLSDVLQRPLTYRDGGEVGPGLGAARLAQLSFFADLARQALQDKIRQICPPPDVLATHEPDAAAVEYYRPKLERFRKLYQLTRHLSV